MFGTPCHYCGKPLGAWTYASAPSGVEPITICSLCFLYKTELYTIEEVFLRITQLLKLPVLSDISLTYDAENRLVEPSKADRLLARMVLLDRTAQISRVLGRN